MPVVTTLVVLALIGNIHKSVDGSLFLRKMIFPSYITSQLVLVNTSLHPASHSTLIPIKDAMDSVGTTCPTKTAMDSVGTTCPTKTVGSPGMVMWHVCVGLTLLTSGKFMVSGWIAGRRFWTGVPSILNNQSCPRICYCLQCCNSYCIEVLWQRGAK